MFTISPKLAFFAPFAAILLAAAAPTCVVQTADPQFSIIIPNGVPVNGVLPNGFIIRPGTDCGIPDVTSTTAFVTATSTSTGVSTTAVVTTTAVTTTAVTTTSTTTTAPAGPTGPIN